MKTPVINEGRQLWCGLWGFVVIFFYYTLCFKFKFSQKMFGENNDPE